MAYTGYIVRKYIDENPNSPTYGETWTEKTLDTTHCPNDGGGWSLVATECELVTSGFTGYRIDTYYNSVTNDYRTERTLDSLCQASTDDEIWYNIGDVYCEQNDDGTYTGFGIQEQKQINPNLYNFGIVRKTRVASEECQEHLDPIWQQLSKECNIVQEPGTGNLHYDGTANILQIDINPSSPTFNQTRTINVEDEECEYIPCERMEYEWFYKEESCGSLIPEYYHLENIVPDNVYKIYQMYSKCYVDNVVIRERPENVYSAVTYQEGVTDCLYRWVQTEQTVCEDTYRERWVNSGTTCEDANKYNVQVKEITEDGGETWSATSETRLGTMIEANSEDCGYRTRTESGTPYCDYSNYNKCVRVENQVSRDSGATWETTATTIEVIAEHSADCGYVDPRTEYLTFVPLENGVFTVKNAFDLRDYTYKIDYSRDSGSTWTTLELPTGTTKSINAYTGQKILWKGYGNGQNYLGYLRFNSTCRYNIEGNAMSLDYGNNFTGQTVPESTKAACKMSNFFSNNTKLISAERLLLPEKQWGDNYTGDSNDFLYNNMFDGCTSLTTAPSVLPATTLGRSCYYRMFYNCSSLTGVSENMLPSINLAHQCYYGMFYGCTSLRTAPRLPAADLPANAYTEMFENCTSLTTVPELSFITVGVNPCWGMFEGCTSLTNVPSVLMPTTLSYACYLNMFKGCTSLRTAPAICATTTSEGSCWGMFAGCTSLTTAPSVLLPATVGKDTYLGMFDGCTSLRTAPVICATTFDEGACTYMFRGCTNLNYVKCLATNPSNTYKHENIYMWLDGVSSSGTFVKNASTTWPTGKSGIPNNWSIQNA